MLKSKKTVHKMFTAVPYLLLFLLYSNVRSETTMHDIAEDNNITVSAASISHTTPTKGYDIVTLSPNQGYQVDGCTLINDNGMINLWAIGNEKGNPRWQNHMTTNPSFDSGLYSFDPCYPFDKGDCKNSLACRSNALQQDQSIADQSTGKFLFDDISNTYIIQYTAGKAGENQTITNVILKCLTKVQDTLEVIGHVSNNIYIMTLTSRCCCPGACASVITPGQKSISLGSIICIMFVCTVFVYFISGMVYMKTIRRAEGIEIIPHVAFWMDLPNLIMDGVTFMFSCGKSTVRTPEGPGTGSKSTYESI